MPYLALPKKDLEKVADPDALYGGPSRHGGHPKGDEQTSEEIAILPSHRVGRKLILFDVTDLLQHIAIRTNLTGIQRVQASVILTLTKSAGFTESASLLFLTFDTMKQQWLVLSVGFLVNLLREMFLPRARRKVAFSAEDAKHGLLPYSTIFDTREILGASADSVFCLLGTGWIHQDYFNRVLPLKLQFGTRIAITVHDLIPINLPETCDSATVRLFDSFLRRSLRYADHILCVSECTARDLRHYIAARSLRAPSISVTLNGSSFAQFLPEETSENKTIGTPSRFVLFVGTIEARKNHKFILKCWRRMFENGENPPDLLCLGMIGWKCESFLTELAETDFLSGKVHVVTDVSDSELQQLYNRSLFTLCPSLYEGWGLPVGESLAHGKICVCSDKGAIPEVAGELGAYIDINDLERSLHVIRSLIQNVDERSLLEERIRREYQPIEWDTVTGRIVDGCLGTIVSDKTSDDFQACLPYSTEITFAGPELENGMGGSALFRHILQVRCGHFLSKGLSTDCFLWGEQTRSGGAWSVPEDWGTWLRSPRGELTFDLKVTEDRYFNVYLRLRTGEPTETLTLALSANGDLRWKGIIGPAGRDILLRIRRPDAGRDDNWRLVLTVVVVASDVMQRPDGRSNLEGAHSALGFERIIIVPESDYAARTEILWRAGLGTRRSGVTDQSNLPEVRPQLKRATM